MASVSHVNLKTTESDGSSTSVVGFPPYPAALEAVGHNPTIAYDSWRKFNFPSKHTMCPRHRYTIPLAIPRDECGRRKLDCLQSHR